MKAHMQRREFMGLIGAAGVSWMAQGSAASAQQSTVPVIGFIHSASPSYFAQFASAVRDGLKEAGYIEGRNVTIEYRWAEGHYERLPALVEDLVKRHVAEIFAAGGTDPAKAAKATSTIPIVFISAADPVGTGLVANLNKPGGNITGVSLLAAALDAKKLALLRDLVATASTIGAVINPDYPGATSQSEEFLEATERLGVRPLVLHARNDGEIESAFASLRKAGASALMVSSDPLFNSLRELFSRLASEHALPVIYPQREYVTVGGLMSYGPHFGDGYRQAGVYAGRILAGASPAELPVLQPVKFELVINLKSAKTLGVDMPQTLLAIADEVIE
jgi:putative tryptophan/tyrosine transport system substrate-binding protein